MSLFALAVAAAISGTAGDPASDNESDIRCVAVIAAVMPNTDEQTKAALSGGMLYFIGRIEGRTPSYDLESNLNRLSKQPMDDLMKDTDRCAKIMTEKGNMLMAMGERAGG